MTPVVSTYRLQLRGDAFTLADAEDLLDYLDDLGISHVYLSPILTAVTGSTHGYDVTDPTTVSGELGGADALRNLSAAARARGIGLVVDIVPNHVGVGQPMQNPWFCDVLRHGRESAYARFFDIDWELDEGRIVLPVLGADEDANHLTVDGDVLRLGDLAFPIAPGTGSGTGPEVHDRQHYRLIGWRRGICGYRRFFAITSLAGLRQEDREVFDTSHVEVRRWFSEGLVDGVRVDHPDGLSDPTGYLSWLREIAGRDAWIVVEKILAAGEPLDPTLPVAGTTGYDALREIGGLLVDPTGEAGLTALSDSAGTDYQTMPALARELKAKAVTDTLSSELGRLCRVIVAAAGVDHPRLAEAVAELVSRIPVYRSDYPCLSSVLPAALAETTRGCAEFAEPLQVLATALARCTECTVRLQQLCGAATAKSVEDCLFYRDSRLVSLNEVGGEPELFGMSAAEFHQRASDRARSWPAGMTTISTHDTKRGEDVRARIGVLSQVPSLWAEFVGGWELRVPSPDPATGLFLWQNIFGVWPADGVLTDQFRARLHAYAEKAIREAAVLTSWSDPDQAFESAVHAWLDAIFDGPVATELTGLAARLDPHARNDALAQKLLHLTAPGIPDVYQGTELWDDSLVDPDNRRPVDYTVRRAALAALEHPKIRVTAAALRLRRRRPAAFLTGGYAPLLASGSARHHIVAFSRGDDVVTAVSRWTVRLEGSGWGDTVLPLPAGRWTEVLTDRPFTAGVAARDVFDDLPVALLERTDA
ncbi:MAG: malto-oligosyltrehalose synthase [Mycobacteriaceae bacterium]|nr:malto-oligosyltrehalose synthase [Mycobacteriaceae bacterium]